MNTPHLIQRGRFQEVHGPIQGIDGLVSFDYMGSAEFEFGALPRSLKEMCKAADGQQMYEVGIRAHNGKGVFLVCTEAQTEKALVYVKELANPKCSYRLKEGARFVENLTGVSFGKPLHSFNTFDFWWDINNHYMFCLGKNNAKNLVKAIVAVRDRKQREGVEGWY